MSGTFSCTSSTLRIERSAFSFRIESIICQRSVKRLPTRRPLAVLWKVLRRWGNWVEGNCLVYSLVGFGIMGDVRKNNDIH
jgi:hypothetical protein